MSRKKNTTYSDAAEAVLTELGGGPVRSKDLVKAILDKGLVADGEYTYHYILKAVRDNPETFDTSKRGHVSLIAVGTAPAEASSIPDVLAALEADEDIVFSTLPGAIG